MRVRSREQQRGWIGLVVLLLALVVVGLVARTALKSYGLLGEPKTRHAAAPGASEIDQAAATTPGGALQRARGLQDMVKQQAAEQEKHIDDAIPK